MVKETIYQFIDYIKQLNVYTAKDEDTVEERRDQFVATRLFLVLFVISLIGLVGYASLTLRLTNVKIPNPSQSKFEKLHSLYAQTLVCPCSQTSIQISKFVQFHISYHQICSSIFVDDQWISSITNSVPNSFYSLDSRRMLSSQLQLIASYCRLSKKTVNDILENVGSNQLSFSTVISKDLLESQVEQRVNEVKSDIFAKQQQSRTFIQIINQGNQLVSALSSNYLYRNINDEWQGYYAVTYLKNQTYPPSNNLTSYVDANFCYCAYLSNCIYPSGIYPTLTGLDSYEDYGSIIPPIQSSTQIPGLYAGCRAFDATVASTLECFYDHRCLLQLFNQTHIKPLNASINSNFTIDTKVEVLVDNLFIESWINDKDFEAFFQQCQPIQCTYAYNARGNLAYVFIMMLSLVGGLFSALKIASSSIVLLYYKIKAKIMRCSSRLSTSDNNTQNDLRTANESTFSVRKISAMLYKWIVNFDLFEEAYNDAHGRRNEVISTRVYLLLVIVGLMAIIFYASLVEYSVTYHIKSPSFGTYRELVDEYPSLACECKELTATYEKFITFSPRFHQLCSSIFASDKISLLYENRDALFILGYLDPRAVLTSFFSYVNTGCTFSIRTINQFIDAFLQTTYVGSYLTHEEEFILRMNASIQNFLALASPTINQLVQLTQGITQGNLLLTRTFDNAKLQYNTSSTNEDDKINMIWSNPINESCSCAISSDSCDVSYDDYCNRSYTLINGTCDDPLNGFRFGCYLFSAMMISSFECTYDLICVSRIPKLIANISKIDINLIPQSWYLLNKNLSSRVAINSTAYEMGGAMMVEEWNSRIEYESYYDECRPMNCFYTITTMFNIPTVVTTVIGLFGGLTVILRILIPPIIAFLRQHRRMQIVQIQVPAQMQRSRCYRLMENIREMNIFKDAQTDQSTEHRYHQILSTRLYISLLIICVLILAINSGIARNRVTVYLDSPSMSLVNQLQAQNLQEFSCPCSTVTILFKPFTSLTYTLHQICSSDFVSSDWLKGIFNVTSGYSVSRAVLGAHFKLLESYCQSANQTLLYAISNFYAKQLISPKLLSQQQFAKQVESANQDFRSITINAFQRNVALMIAITLGNQFMSVYGTNWHFIPHPQGDFPFYTKARSYGNCSCATPQSLYCADQLFINNATEVPGMFIGCLPVTSLRLSSIQCFYNQTCVNEVQQALQLTNLHLTALHPSQGKQYLPETTLDSLIDNLMLDDWNQQMNYSEYFNQCHLEECTYSVTKGNNPLVIFTTLLGLYGGLTVTLKFIAPTLIRLTQRIRYQHRLNSQTIP